MLKNNFILLVIVVLFSECGHKTSIEDFSNEATAKLPYSEYIKIHDNNDYQKISQDPEVVKKCFVKHQLETYFGNIDFYVVSVHKVIFKSNEFHVYWTQSCDPSSCFADGWRLYIYSKETNTIVDSYTFSSV